MKVKIVSIAIKLIIRERYNISFCLMSHVDMANAKSGNLTQLKPFNNDCSTINDSKEEMTPANKKNIAHLTQLIFSHSQDELTMDFIRNENPITVINISVRDLLIIIIKGIKIQMKPNSFSNLDLS